jgi:hypothetical protein
MTKRDASGGLELFLFFNFFIFYFFFFSPHTFFSPTPRRLPSFSQQAEYRIGYRFRCSVTAIRRGAKFAFNFALWKRIV